MSKQTEYETCASDTKKNYLQRDISILTELLQLISWLLLVYPLFNFIEFISRTMK